MTNLQSDWLALANCHEPRCTALYPPANKVMFTSTQTATKMAYEEKNVAWPMHCKHPLSLRMPNVRFCILLWQ